MGNLLVRGRRGGWRAIGSKMKYKGTQTDKMYTVHSPEYVM